jgi:hypothetical protein
MRAALVIMIALPGCVPLTPVGLAKLSPNLSVESKKSPHDFAMCVASAFPDTGQVLNDGPHYWVTRQFGGSTIERWDFIPVPSGSTAERRTGQRIDYGAKRVRGCS